MDLTGVAAEILKCYHDICTDAQDEFYWKHWPCEKEDENKLRCVNVASGHSKGHQKQSGKVFAAGEYQSSFNLNQKKERDCFLESILSELKKLTQMPLLPQDKEQRQKDEQHAAARIHLSQISKFWGNNPGKTKSQISHTICFCCLHFTPEHILHCGHIICQQCLEDSSFLSEDHSYRHLNGCPLCEKLPLLWKTKVKPPTAGLRVLSLDG